jgi:hypothetical protein
MAGLRGSVRGLISCPTRAAGGTTVQNISGNRITHRWRFLAALVPFACAPGSQPVTSPATRLATGTLAASLPLTTEPSPISLGRLKPGQSACVEVVVRNSLGEAIGPARLKSSCPCLVVSPSEIDVGPSDSVAIRVTFDPSESPDFRGELAVPISGVLHDGLVVFRATIRLAVIETSTLANVDR